MSHGALHKTALKVDVVIYEISPLSEMFVTPSCFEAIRYVFPKRAFLISFESRLIKTHQILAVFADEYLR